MEALLKLPETWHVVVTDENRKLVNEYANYNIGHDYVYGDARLKFGDIARVWTRNYNPNFGQEITTADFKRLVLGERNFEDYGVIGCQELCNYIGESRLSQDYQVGYFYNGEWDWFHISNFNENLRNIRQTLPLKEYLKLLPTEKTETMEKKYKYKIKDEKYIDVVYKITHLRIDKHFFQGNALPEFIETLSNNNVLDLFFDKVEVVELPIINGEKVIYNGFDWFNIDGFEIKKDFIIHKGIHSFTLSNGTEVTEEHVNQIRKYLNK